MVELLITRKNDGTYVLSESGLRQAYFRTMHKLLAYYLQNALKKGPDESKQILVRYQQFAEQELRNPNDYLEKLPQLAQLIGEANAARFASFIGQHFLTQLEKTQQGILDTELPKFKDFYENPYRVPSHELLLLWGELFRQAKPLVWPPPNQSLVDQEESSAAPPEEVATQSAVEPLPGAVLLEKWGDAFRAAQELNWVPQAIPTDNSSDSSEEVVIDEPVAKEQPVLAPGERLLQAVSLEFANAKPLQWSPSGPSMEEEAEEAENFANLPTQILLREFVPLSSMVSRFTKNKDNVGYQQWYSQLEGRSKLILHLNTLLTRSERGESIYWQSELSSLAQKTGHTTEVVSKMKEEIAAYRQVMASLQKSLQAAVQAGLPAAQAQQLYGSLLALLENKDTLAAKRTALKMTLLAVMVPAAKQILEEQLTALIDKIGELYPLPEV